MNSSLCAHDWRGIDTGRMCAICLEKEEQFRGTTFDDLFVRVDIALAVSAAQKEAHMARLCRNCRAPYADHGNFTLGCPAPAHTKFQVMTCQASVFENQCEAECVPGSEFCANHQGE